MFDPGMTLRDYFAGQALAIIPLRDWSHLGHEASLEYITEAWARCAYAAADAMLKQKNLKE